MRKYIIMFCGILVATLASAGTASFDAIRANEVTVRGNEVITNIVVNGTNYSGGSVTIPPGPKGDTGATGSSGTNFIGYTFTNINLNLTVTTNITTGVITNTIVYTNSADSISNIAVNGTTGTVAGGIASVTITSGGGTFDHNALTNILGGGSNHVTAAEQTRIPPAWGSNTMGYLTCTGTNQQWQAVGVNFMSNLYITWDHQTNFSYAGIVTQNFQIPYVPGFTVPLVQIKAWGAGGGGAGGVGGAGGFAAGTYDGSAVTNIYIIVGGGGLRAVASNGYSAWPGGGPVYTNGSSSFAGSGGGYSQVSLNHVTNCVLIAAGGGGNGYSVALGGAGGGSIGASGGVGGASTASTGGGMTDAGVGGTWAAYPNAGGQNGAGMIGGGNTTNAASYRGGSGGGGFYGGGAGASGLVNQPGGGAGGSCYGQYVERGNNAADESYFGSIGSGGAAANDGQPGGVVIRWRYVAQ